MKTTAVRRLELVLAGFLAALAVAPCAEAAFTWGPRADVIGQQFGRGLHGGATIANRIHVAGGGFIAPSLWLSFQDAAVYDPVSDTWAASADMSTRRTAPASAAAFLGAEERLYVIGGMDLSGFPIDHFTHRDIEEYDPLRNTWRIVGSGFPDRQTWGACAVTVDGRIFIVGGVDDGFDPLSARLVAYDPNSDSYQLLTPMPAGSSDGACATVGRKIYWFSGYGSRDGWGALPVAGTHVYDVDADTWSTAAPIPTPRANAAAIAIGSTVYVMGGWDGSTQYRGMYRTIDAYDTATDRWAGAVPDPLGCVPDDGVNFRGRAGFTLHEADDGTAVRVFAIGGNVGISVPTRCNESSPRPAVDTEPPLFGGLDSAREIASCTTPPAPSVQLDWVEGQDVTPPVVYNVYRGATALFIPDASTLIASRVSGNRFTDVLSSAECFQSFWYVVRGEDSATPPNMESNTNRVQVDLLCAPPVTPASVGNLLQAVKDPTGLPSLDWSRYAAGPEVSHYHVRRTVSKLGLPGGIVDEPTDRSWLDPSVPGNQYLYQIRSANSCETESAN